jgi:hypothetical protein
MRPGDAAISVCRKRASCEPGRLRESVNDLMAFVAVARERSSTRAAHGNLIDVGKKEGAVHPD